MNLLFYRLEKAPWNPLNKRGEIGYIIRPFGICYCYKPTRVVRLFFKKKKKKINKQLKTYKTLIIYRNSSFVLCSQNKNVNNKQSFKFNWLQLIFLANGTIFIRFIFEHERHFLFYFLSYVIIIIIILKSLSFVFDNLLLV